MNSLTEEKINSFIKLKELTFAEYDIIYHINDCFSINQLSAVHSKHQLLFTKYSDKIQQMNLVLIDSLFPTILADVALEVFLNKVTTFQQYIQLKKTFSVIDSINDRHYLKHKFVSFIHHLLYSEISSKAVCTGEIQSDKVYCLKNSAGELQFYSIFEQNELQLMLLDKLQLQINHKSSSISDEQIKLSLQIKFIE